MDAWCLLNNSFHKFGHVMAATDFDDEFEGSSAPSFGWHLLFLIVFIIVFVHCVLLCYVHYVLLCYVTLTTTSMRTKVNMRFGKRMATFSRLMSRWLSM